MASKMHCLVFVWCMLVALFTGRRCVGANGTEAAVNQQVGGTDIRDKEYKSFVAILSIAGNKFSCGGVLVGSRYVLTALHCFARDEFSLFRVQVGYLCTDPDNCGRPTELITIDSMWPHPKGGDLALLVLRRAVSRRGIRPAVPYLGKTSHPDQTRIAKGVSMKLVSAGREGTFEATSPRVQKLTVKFYPLNKCKKKISKQSLFHDSTVCSLPQKGSSPCGGDSGSPLMVRGKGRFRKRDVVLAIHNWGPGDCSDAKGKTPVGHFRLRAASELLLAIICEGDFPEDWCNKPPPLQASLLRTISARQGSVEVISLQAESRFPSTRMVTVGGCDDTPSSQYVKFWDSKDGSDLATLNGHRACVTALAYDLPGNVMISGDDNGVISLWFVDGSPGGTYAVREDFYSQLDSRINDLTWQRRGVLIAAAVQGSSQIWMLEGSSAETVSPQMSGHTDDVHSVSFHPTANLLASGSADGTVKLWDFAETSRFVLSYKELASLEDHTDEVMAVAFSPDGKWLASASLDDTVRIWEVTIPDPNAGGTAQGTLRHTLTGHSHWVLCVSWSPDGQYVVSGSVDNALRVWDAIEGGEALLVLNGHSSTVQTVAWGPEGGLVASGSDDGKVLLWNVTESPS